MHRLEQDNSTLAQLFRRPARSPRLPWWWGNGRRRDATRDRAALAKGALISGQPLPSGSEEGLSVPEAL